MALEGETDILKLYLYTHYHKGNTDKVEYIEIKSMCLSKDLKKRIRKPKTRRRDL